MLLLYNCFRENSCIRCCDLASATFGLSTERQEACKLEGCRSEFIVESTCTELFGTLNEQVPKEEQRLGCELGRSYKMLGLGEPEADNFGLCFLNDQN